MKNENRISLDGTWDFQVASSADNPEPTSPTWRSAVVPMPWQAQFDDLRLSSGTAWYRRHFLVDGQSLQPAGQIAAILHFGAVDYYATLWLNGVQIGEHEGGYLPFELEVSPLLRPGDNELLLRVTDSTDDRQQYPDYPFSEVPHGKQSWYGPMAGIWQSVWLEFRPACHITHLALNPNPAAGSVGVTVSLSQPLPAGSLVRLTLLDPQGIAVSSLSLDGDLTGSLALKDAPMLWDLANPNLYTVTAAVITNQLWGHSVSKTCGFRTVEARDGRIYLNGNPIYLRGVLDQGYFPETIYTPISLDYLEKQAVAIKNLGFNCLRIHIKVEDPRYYDVADRLGLLVWTEIPNSALLTEKSSQRARQVFAGMLERDNHHPSIIAWTLINENWGTDLSRNPEHRQWLVDFYQQAKQQDPTRIIVDNSACGGNSHVAGDLEDYHEYRAIPDHAHNWDKWVADFSSRTSEWVWYPDCQQNRRADLPLIVSEFGNWGLPDPATLLEHGREPWWFETGYEWDSGIVYPHGVLKRFENSGLAELFPSYAEFARHSQAHMARSLQFEINSMRWLNPIAGYIVTECTDVHWECNGMLTMQREPKYMLDPLLKNLNQDLVVLLRPTLWSNRPGSEIEVAVQTMDISGLSAVGSIQWRFGAQSGQLSAPGGIIQVTLDAPQETSLFVDWTDAGNILASNQINLVCVDTQPAGAKLHISEDTALANCLRNLGYAVSEGQPDSAAADEIVVTSSYTPAIQAHLQSGGRVVFLADLQNSEGIPTPVGYIQPRAGTSWQGDWANSFSWIKKSGSFAHLPGAPLLEMEWSGIMPDSVISGLPTWVMRSHSWANLALGWVHKVVSLLSVMPYGKGHILVTTFKLNASTLSSHAMAQALFAGMLNLL